MTFSSALAERYYSKWLFSNRGLNSPPSLYNLMRKVIRNMSASVLAQSTVGKDSFPKEATFLTLQHWLFEKNEMPQPSTDQIHVLVVVPKRDVVGTTSPQIFTSYRPYAEVINVLLPHLSGDALVEELYDAVLSTNFVLLSS